MEGTMRQNRKILSDASKGKEKGDAGEGNESIQYSKKKKKSEQNKKMI